ncbi:MAG: FG-GAP repeat protein [Planctomycetota bacterium]
MQRGLWAALLVVFSALVPASRAQDAPLLQIQGEPFSEGELTLHFSGTPGHFTALLYGLQPLITPVWTPKGPFYIGQVLNVLALGAIPPSGRIDMPITLPLLDPLFSGIPIVLQGLVPGALTNPATLPLDQPYLTPATGQVISNPNPTDRALFGRTVGVGDFNGDGFGDIVGCAEGEDYLGIQNSGAAYVLWGPDYTNFTALYSELPHYYGFFGVGMTVGRLDGDELDDLIIGETAGAPPVPGLPGKLYVYSGATLATGVPTLILHSPGTGIKFTGYGHAIAIGDFNNDSHGDVAISINKASVGGFGEAGRVDILLGPDFTSSIWVSNPTPEAGHGFGSCIAVGDANGDGIDDLFEASGGDDIGGVQSIGSAHVYLGPDLTLFRTIECPEPLGVGTAFGIHMGVGDLDGDGTTDLLIDDDRDRAFVHYGPDYESYLKVTKPPSLYENPFGESNFGSWLGAADLSGDGITDLLISDHFDGPMQGCSLTAGGMTFVALGPFHATFARISDKVPLCNVGIERNAFGDLDGDGSIELVLGVASADDFGITNSGHVTILHGAVP